MLFFIQNFSSYQTYTENITQPHIKTYFNNFIAPKKATRKSASPSDRWHHLLTLSETVSRGFIKPPQDGKRINANPAVYNTSLPKVYGYC
jgi:hypothetical protein